MALISAAVMEGARDGKTVAQLMSEGRTVLDPRRCDGQHRRDDSGHPGRATFPDGTKLVTVQSADRLTRSAVAVCPLLEIHHAFPAKSALFFLIAASALSMSQRPYRS